MSQSEQKALLFPGIGSTLLAFVVSFTRLQTVWQTGAFRDTDDAMRAVQVRDFLAGQSWFDLYAHRLDPPGGVLMHWSRIVDIPLAILNASFSVFTTPEYAERATRILFPFLLSCALFYVIGRLATVLSTARWRLGPAFVAQALTLLSGVVFWQFFPGRIDHHALQILLLAGAVAWFLDGLDPSRKRSLGVATAMMACSFAVGLENLPLFAVLIAALPVIFVFEGRALRSQLLYFASGAALAFFFFFFATVSPALYFTAHCDAYSSVHLAAMLSGSAAMALLAFFSDFLETWPKRLVAVAFSGLAPLTLVILVAPQCLGDPYNAVDPLFRDLALANIAEAQSLRSLYSKFDPSMAIAFSTPVLIGIACSVMLAWRHRGLHRTRWLVLAVIIGAGLAAAAWELRAFSSVLPLAMVALASASVELVDGFVRDDRLVLRTIPAMLLAMALSPSILYIALPSREIEKINWADNDCFKPESLAPLSELPKSMILAPMNLGAHILAHTPHSVFAAPYHRNNHGNHVVLEAFTASPDKAEALVRSMGATLVVWCPVDKSILKAAPDGFAAMLARGEKLAWLEQKPLVGTPLTVFTLKPAD